MPSVVEEAKELIDRSDIRLMSLMDHNALDSASFAMKGSCATITAAKKNGGKTDAELDVLFERRFCLPEGLCGDPTCVRSWRWHINTRYRSASH